MKNSDTQMHPVWDPILVSDTSVDTALYWSRSIFQQETERIWKRVWLYVAHESEIENEGDYVTRLLGGEPVVVVRAVGGAIHVVVNRCAHRGNLVCLDDRGTARSFRCPYHGWTFKSDGSLVGVPYRSGFDAEWFDGSHDLHRLPRVDSYRGFVFASFAAEGPSLRTHLGAAASRIDRFVDLAPSGHVEFSGGTHRIRIGANWKMWVENSVDNYHQNFVHQAPLFLKPEVKETSVRVSADESKALVRDLGNGHAELDFSPEQREMGRVHRTSATEADQQSEAAYEKALSDRLGEDAARTLLIDGPPHVLIFPNLFLLQQDARVIEPISPFESLMTQYPVLLGGASDEINLARIRRHEQAYGPAGSVLPDDIEIFERNQSAMDDGTRDRLELQRGRMRERVDDDGLPISHITDELGQRAIWRRYAELMTY